MEISSENSIAPRLKVDKKQQNETQDSASEQKQAEELVDQGTDGKMTSTNSSSWMRQKKQEATT